MLAIAQAIDLVDELLRLRQSTMRITHHMLPQFGRILLKAGWLRYARVAVASMLRVRATVSISSRCL